MSGIQGLLKYRYEKKANAKPPESGAAKNKGSISAKESKQGCADEVECVPDSCESSSAESPTFSKTIQNGKKVNKPTLTAKRGAYVINSSDSEAESPVKVKPAPWLSTDGKKMNGAGDFDNESYNKRVRSLRDMFPTAPHGILEQAAKDNDDLEDAIDDVIHSQTDVSSSGSKKRQRIVSLSSQESSEYTPAKRAKPLPSEEDSIGDEPSSTKDDHDQAVTFLQGAMPAVPLDVIESTLREKNYDLELASIALQKYTPPAPLDHTKNVGSIKAYQLQRQQAKLAAPQKEAAEDSEGEDIDDDFGGGGRKKKKKGMESDDSDEEIEAGDMDDQLLSFFNDSSIEELMCVKGCSRKKAECLIELRPYIDWDDLAAKFEHCTTVNLPFTLITEGKDMIRIRKTLRHLMQKCEQISGDLENIIGSLANRVSMDEKLGVDCLHNQPSNLNSQMKLKPYQMVGLNWLALMYRKKLDGILGDEMGLGKTIQTIAFLAHLLEIGNKGPHVIVAPASTVDNWLRELQLWCPALKVILYYGSQSERRDIRTDAFEGTIGEFHVVLTTYTVASGSAEDRAFFKKIKYHYAIFDEGHMLKNMQSMRYKGLMKIRASRRLLLTGTPLQNNLIELMSLLAFTMPDMFVGQADHLKTIFQAITNRGKDESRGAYEKDVIIQAKRILKPFFLRRLKSQVLQQLPKKTSHVEKVPMCFEQQDLYDDLKEQFTNRLKEAGESSDMKNGASMLMQLRKAANHHLLHRRVFDDSKLRKMAKLMLKEPTHADSNPDLIFEDMQVMSDFELHNLCCNFKSIRQFKLDEDQVIDSGKFRYLDELLATLKENGSRVLLFSQFTMLLDILEVYLKVRQHKYLRLDGATPVAERQELIDEFNTDDDIFVFLLSTKAGGLGINLTAANVVILHDIDFNPYNDKQAEDRCHRVGQTREVTIYKLISRGTVEEAMVACAQAKLNLEEDVTGQNRNEEVENNADVASLLRGALNIQ